MIEAKGLEKVHELSKSSLPSLVWPFVAVFWPVGPASWRWEESRPPGFRCAEALTWKFGQSLVKCQKENLFNFCKFRNLQPLRCIWHHDEQIYSNVIKKSELHWVLEHDLDALNTWVAQSPVINSFRVFFCLKNFCVFLCRTNFFMTTIFKMLNIVYFANYVSCSMLPIEELESWNGEAIGPQSSPCHTASWRNLSMDGYFVSFLFSI